MYLGHPLLQQDAEGIPHAGLFVYFSLIKNTSSILDGLVDETQNLSRSSLMWHEYLYLEAFVMYILGYMAIFILVYK